MLRYQIKISDSEIKKYLKSLGYNFITLNKLLSQHLHIKEDKDSNITFSISAKRFTFAYLDELELESLKRQITTLLSQLGIYDKVTGKFMITHVHRCILYYSISNDQVLLDTDINSPAVRFGLHSRMSRVLEETIKTDMKIMPNSITYV